MFSLSKCLLDVYKRQHIYCIPKLSVVTIDQDMHPADISQCWKIPISNKVNLNYQLFLCPELYNDGKKKKTNGNDSFELETLMLQKTKLNTNIFVDKVLFTLRLPRST